MIKRPTIVDIAKQLGVSVATVHRALRDSPSVTPATKLRVREVAEEIGYQPNLAARALSSKSSIRISVNTLKGTTSFWDEVRAGVNDEIANLDIKNVEIDYRTHSHVLDDELAAFESAVAERVDGIITFPSNPQRLEPLLAKAEEANIPVVCVATDAPASRRIAVVSVNTMASGALAADFMGHVVRGDGAVGATLFEYSVTEHAQKYNAFRDTMRQFYPHIQVLNPLEDHDVEEIGYERCCSLLRGNPNLVGIYVMTELSIPVIQAARDMGRLEDLTIVTTDLFPALAKEIRNGTVTASIYQRPRTQGRMAFRVLHEFLVSGHVTSSRIALAPHLVMRGNLDYFLASR